MLQKAALTANIIFIDCVPISSHYLKQPQNTQDSPWVEFPKYESMFLCRQRCSACADVGELTNRSSPVSTTRARARLGTGPPGCTVLVLNRRPVTFRTVGLVKVLPIELDDGSDDTCWFGELGNGFKLEADWLGGDRLPVASLSSLTRASCFRLRWFIIRVSAACCRFALSLSKCLASASSKPMASTDGLRPPRPKRCHNTLSEAGS